MPISERAEKLFLKAHSLDPETRAQFVTDACHGDQELLDEINSLLAAANESEAFFDELAGKISLAALAEGEEQPLANKVLGPWRLVRLIGQGGMGSVYLAERADGQFEKSAALKILPIGLENPQAKSRFLLERQILARLVHDNIARLLDGGVSDDGIPYFVMDYVEGVPIDAYCEQHELGVAERLRLLLDVARAVQFAHRNLVVHRDLKPSNVLVEPNGRVRLLDFGIAKVIEPGSVPADLTQMAQRPATPGFASPEMLRGEPVDVTTDVYSIGVLLYLLLSGRLPLSYEGLSLPDMHERAATDIAPLVSRFNGEVDADIDAIVSKAIAKLPEERYSSVESLANDIRNWLEGVPVTAKAPTALYRVKKFVSRHWLGVTFVGFAIVALASIAGIASYSAITTERQSRTIALERDRAEQIKDFLVSIFDSADPNRAAAELTAREILDAGRQRIDAELADQPEVQVELLRAIGEVYATIRLTDEWREVLERERDLRAQLQGIDSPEYVDVLIGLSQLEDMAGDYDLSQEYAEQALAVSQALGNRRGEAAAHKRIGRVLHLKGDYRGADAGYRSALDIYRVEYGEDALETDKVRLHLATLLNHTQELEESLAMLERVLETRQQHYPGDHSEYSEVFLAMGSVLNKLDRHDEAVAIYERAFAMNERLFGVDNRFNLYIVNGLGKVAEDKRDYTMAAGHYAEARRLVATRFPDHPNLGIASANLGKAYMRSGRFDLAVPVYREAVTIIERHLPDHWMLGGMRWHLGHCIAKSGGDFSEAEPLILSGIETLKAQWGSEHPTTRAATAAAAELYDAWGKSDEAAKFR